MIAHIYSDYIPKSPVSQARHALARQSWKVQPWRDRGIQDSQLPRLFREGKSMFPYVRDVMDAGCAGLSEDDIAVYSNSDIGFLEDGCVRIAFALQENAAGYSFRNDFSTLPAQLPKPEDMQMTHEYCGKDVYFFRVGWWKAVRRSFPDMVLGREAWDAVMVEFVELTNPNKPLSLPKLCWHVRHGSEGNGSYWEDAQNRYTLPGQRHNLALAKSTLIRIGVDPAKHGIR